MPWSWRRRGCEQAGAGMELPSHLQHPELEQTLSPFFQQRAPWLRQAYQRVPAEAKSWREVKTRSPSQSFQVIKYF